jgi:HAMP domain-containing protein
MADSSDGIAQLKATIRGLRDEMESTTIRHKEEIQGMKTAARDEQKQLHETIAALRDELEKRNGG